MKKVISNSHDAIWYIYITRMHCILFIYLLWIFFWFMYSGRLRLLISKWCVFDKTIKSFEYKFMYESCTALVEFQLPWNTDSFIRKSLHVSVMVWREQLLEYQIQFIYSLNNCAIWFFIVDYEKNLRKKQTNKTNFLEKKQKKPVK